MKLVLTFVLAAALCIAGETAQDRGKRVVDECVAALGGENFRHMQDRVEGGRAYSFYHEQVSGLSIAKIYTHYLSDVTDTANTLAVQEREFFGKKEDSSVLFGQNGAWELTFRGARPITADRFVRYKDTTLHDIMYILRIRLHEPGMVFESRGADVFDNRPVEIVDISDAQNRVTTVYFDQIDKWPVRQFFYRRDEVTKDKNEETTTFTKYRDIGNGVKWPFGIHRERNGDKIYEMFCNEGKLNETVKSQMFMLPSDVKLLKPE